MLRDRLESDPLDVVERDPEGDRVRDVHRAGLELPGDVVPSGALELDLADHLPASEEGGHRFQVLALPIEGARARGP